MLKVLIIDDEQPARDRLTRLLGPIAACEVVGQAASGAEALQRIEELAPDVLLLDISMPGMDGMALARVLQQGGVSPAVIFCTAYQDQALKAFEVEAIDYVVKPVRADRLEKALDKARRFLGDAGNGSETHFIRSTVGGKVVLTPIDRVICLIAEDKYTTVIHENGSTVVDDSLTELEHHYPEVFLRVHRNALVSRNHLRGLERSSEGPAQVILSGTDRRPEVSRRNVAALRKFLNELS
jgi:two-component system response regulator AlgR